MKIGLITLGCDKNTVDSERYLAQLIGHGAHHTERLEEAEVIVVNTCGFIDAAKQESIETLIEAGRLKVEGACRAVVAVGCLVERHKAELAEELPEVDLLLGASEMDRLVPELEARGLFAGASWDTGGARRDPDSAGRAELSLVTRLPLPAAAPHVRYLKISEGCDHGCAFCAIPLMRGKHRSFALDAVVQEARLLEQQGAREVNLVAQDLAHYGRDVRDGIRLPELLEALLAETGIPWFRLLYVYSAGLTPALLALMAREPRIVPYLDIPIQHGSDAVLARMRRPERARSIRETVSRVRQAVPGVAIRTTCIVGFPGETEEEFAELLALLEEVAFDRVGAFTYSPQEGTRAAELHDDVPMDVKLERLDRLSDVQRAITAERYERQLGGVVRAMVDGPDEEDAHGVRARLIWQADDVDGITHLAGVPGAGLPPGTIVEARLTELVDDVDFRATYLRTVDAVQPAVGLAAPRRPRALPVMAAGAVGSFGR